MTEATTSSLRIGGSDFMHAAALCYGENARQKKAELLKPVGHVHDPLALHSFIQIKGVEPSFINITDMFRLLETATRIGAVWEKNLGYVPSMAIAVKHGSACGAAIGIDPHRIIRQVVDGDFEAISGGFVLTNFAITADLARLLRRHHMDDGQERVLDGVIAPAIDGDAIEALDRVKTGKCRMFVNKSLSRSGLGMRGLYLGDRYRQVRGDFLKQDGDPYVLDLPAEWRKDLSAEACCNIMLGWAIGSTANSNSIVLTKDSMLIGAGTGQRSRVAACDIALYYARKYKHDPAGSTAYSDSFFPFKDGPEVLAKAGISTTFATSGSIRDDEVREACAFLGMLLLQLPDKEARGFYGH
jgi:phosphoribosylaminoimidazolecarboxamide formyltransferase/IMP cyclohydrolase